MIGRTLSHYKDMYLAEDRKLSRKIALKVVPPQLAERGRARFDRFLAATAAVYDLTLLTADKELLRGKGFSVMSID